MTLISSKKLELPVIIPTIKPSMRIDGFIILILSIRNNLFLSHPIKSSKRLGADFGTAISC